MSDSLSESEGLTPSPATTYKKHVYIEFKKNVIAYLGGKCVVCGATDNLEFDHVDPTIKLFNITDKYTCCMSYLRSELDKCQLLCKTHHKEKHKQDNIHGTYYMYNHGKCRCTECRKANAEYSRQLYKKKQGVAQSVE